MRPEFFFSNYFRDALTDDVQSFRDKSLKQITKYEWPKFKKSEFWKYTNPDVFFKDIDNPNLDIDSSDLIDIDEYLIEDAINILDTEDGFLVRDALPKGVSILSILDFPKKLENESLNLDSSKAKPLKNFSLLNNSYLNSGFYLKVDDNVNIDIPVQIIYTKGSKHVFRKNIIEIGKFSKATIIETYISKNKLNLFFNIDTNIQLDDSSILNHYKIELANSYDKIFNNVNVNINKDAYYNNFYFTNGGNKIKNNIVSNLSQEGSQTNLNGLYLLKNKDHVDNTTVINHVKPNTKSRQLYKGLLNDNSEATFDGLVEIFKNAKLSDSNQLNQNMLLSEKATINSMPQLVIGNDDVKCSHGSTSGQMDKNQLFYLQSRGLSKEEGTKLLSKAFIYEILLKIEEDDIREFLINIINKIFWS
jgi:Fe-S cluster assembly protein SufD